MAKILYCSFCGKSQQEVKSIISGRDSSICSECVSKCANKVKSTIGLVATQDIDFDSDIVNEFGFFPPNHGSVNEIR